VAGTRDRTAAAGAAPGTGPRRARWWKIGGGPQDGLSPHEQAAPAAASDVQPLVPLLVKPMEGRTGTTLLMALLGTSDDIVVDRTYPYENRYLLYLSHILTPAGEQFAPGTPGYPWPGWGMDELMLGLEDRLGPMPFQPLSLDLADYRARLIRHAWAAFSESTAAFAGRAGRYYAEKSIPRAVELFGAAGIPLRLLTIVRDPRDVLASIRAFDEKRGSYGFGRVPGSSDEEYLALVVEQMRTSLEWIDGTAGRFDASLVRYEDLVTDLGGVAGRLSEWLGITLDPSRRADLERHLDEHATSTSAARSVGRWREDLLPAEARYIERELRPWMEAYSYETGASD
jgi:hypothetical protein